MFEVGERVVCVDVEQSGWQDYGSVLLERGAVYVVAGVILKGTTPAYLSLKSKAASDAVMVEGVPGFGRYAEYGFAFQPFQFRRFRKLTKLDTSESLKALKDLTVNCPPLETVGG